MSARSVRHTALIHHRAIKTNPDVLPSSPILQLFLNDFWGTPLTHSGSHKSYRPLTVLSFRLNYLLGGFEPLTYHATNVLLHVLATFLFATLTKAIAPPQARVFGAAAPLLFAAHPVHTEAVAGVVGRADVGAAIFLLLALISYIRHCRGGSYRGRLCKGSACKGSSRSCSDSCSSRAPLPGRGPSGTNQTSGRPSFPPAGPRVPHAPGRAPPSQGTHSPGPSLITSLPSGTPPPLGSNGPQTSYRPQWTIPRWGCGPYLWVAVLCSTLSMLCKETGIAALGLCAVHRLCLHSRARITDLPRLLRQVGTGTDGYAGQLVGTCPLQPSSTLHPPAYGNLANILSARGQKAEAEWAYKRALAHRSNMADVHYNL
ncbi:hypothetical protein HAZT_HAZT005264 [Hyalella azteca]|uniref:Uncharacterized protein n=1 Tax=Hyalella azteca TaxID=294128 RepID=A0A6A0GW65_HYAAZ|nr:hypothetical protein HAZT_HAZT005264 [Hyalella azteca]